MHRIFHRLKSSARIVGLLGSCLLAAPAVAEVSGDFTFINCSQSGGSFRISELNRSIFYFSDKYQEYRPVCRNCEVTEWGDNITMKDGVRTIVRIDRISGRVLVRGNQGRDVVGSYTQPFQGICVRGKASVARPAPLKTARAF